MGPGEPVGEIGWLTGARRSASVVAVEPTRLLEVRSPPTESFGEGNATLVQKLASIMDQRLRRSRLVMSSEAIADGLTGWHRRRQKGNRDVDVVLLSHPRDANDLRRAVPWLGNLPDGDIARLARWLRPVFAEILQADLFSVGVLILPRLARDLVDPEIRGEVRRIVMQDCVSLANANGTKVLCLGGLTAALMKYGAILQERAEELGMRITSGHAMTSVSCVHTFLTALEQFELETEGRRLVIVGVGSVGSAFLRLLLTKPQCPTEIVLVDLPAQEQRLESLIEQLKPDLPSSAKLSYVLTGGHAILPDDHVVYQSPFVFTATSTPELVDIDKVAPGTLLVDDSQPHCWARAAAWRRFSSKGDIYPCEAGLIDCSALGFRSFFPFDFVEDLKTGTTHTWCCLTEGLLMAMNRDLEPTVGEPTISSMLAFEKAFEDSGLRPAPLRCANQLLVEMPGE
jgi:predicted amino acid dehydrogenase